MKISRRSLQLEMTVHLTVSTLFIIGTTFAFADDNSTFAVDEKLTSQGIDCKERCIIDS